jgi:hypothetical protein
VLTTAVEPPTAELAPAGTLAWAVGTWAVPPSAAVVVAGFFGSSLNESRNSPTPSASWIHEAAGVSRKPPRAPATWVAPASRATPSTK